jgi:hypothetical protein
MIYSKLCVPPIQVESWDADNNNDDLHDNYNENEDDDDDDNNNDDKIDENTDLGHGSDLILEFVYKMFSAEDDWEDIMADNDSSGACLEVLDKFMDEYKTHFDANGKILQDFTLFDQESIPYEDLLQAVRSSKCKDHKNEARTTKLARKEVPSNKAKAKPTTATMNVYQSKSPC